MEYHQLALKKKRKGQTILDFVLAFIVLGVLIIGITRIWAWFNLNYAHRQTAYQRSRPLAANASRYNNTTFTYIDTGAQENCTNCTYAHLDLSQDWVFGANPPVISKYNETLSGYADITAECEARCEREAACFNNTICSDTDPCGYGNYPPCCSELSPEDEPFNHNCACFAQCICEEQISDQITSWAEQEDDLRRESADLHNSSADLKRASKGVWIKILKVLFADKTSDELYLASIQVNAEAIGLAGRADWINNTTAKLNHCCDYSIIDADNNGIMDGAESITYQSCIYNLTQRYECNHIIMRSPDEGAMKFLYALYLVTRRVEGALSKIIDPDSGTRCRPVKICPRGGGPCTTNLTYENCCNLNGTIELEAGGIDVDNNGIIDGAETYQSGVVTLTHPGKRSCYKQQLDPAYWGCVDILGKIIHCSNCTDMVSRYLSGQGREVIPYYPLPIGKVSIPSITTDLDCSFDGVRQGLEEAEIWFWKIYANCKKLTQGGVGEAAIYVDSPCCEPVVEGDEVEGYTVRAPNSTEISACVNSTTDNCAATYQEEIDLGEAYLKKVMTDY